MKTIYMTRAMGALVVTAFALLAVASPAMAAGKKDALGGKGPGIRAIDLIDLAISAVTLDDAQKASIHAIVEDARAQAATLAADAKAVAEPAADRGGKAKKGERQAARTKVAELVAQTTGKINALLNDEQKAAFRQALADERAKARDARGQRGAGAKKAK